MNKGIMSGMAPVKMQEGGEAKTKYFGKDGLIFDTTNPLDYAMAIPGLGLAGAGIKALSTGNKMRKAANAASKLSNPATNMIAAGALGYDLAQDEGSPSEEVAEKQYNDPTVAYFDEDAGYFYYDAEDDDYYTFEDGIVPDGFAKEMAFGGLVALGRAGVSKMPQLTKGISNLFKKNMGKTKPKPSTKTTTKPKTKKPLKEQIIEVLPEEMLYPIAGMGNLTMNTLKGLGNISSKGLGKAGQGNPIKGGIRAGMAVGTGFGIGSALKGDPEVNPTKKLKIDIEKADSNDSDALKDILKERTMTVANEAGREQPVFIDYVKAFPGSYMEKVERDPEFAKQMMAGFLAMMQPSEGFVPRNAIADFGQAAMAEEARQEASTTDQEKLLAMSDEDIQRLQKIQSGSKGFDQTALASAASLLAQFREELTSKKDGKLTDVNGNEINLISFLAMFQKTGGDIEKLSQMIVAGE